MSRRNAFTLVELAIVLVILGLLVGGVLAGQNLIRAAELRAIITEFNQYQTAVRTFQGKYFGLPGDITNATAFWGVDPNGCPDGEGASGTCDGNGDGNISNIQVINRCESHEFFRQLSLSGLIEGSYTTIAGGSSDCFAIPTPGTHNPLSQIDGAAWMIYYRESITSGASWPGNRFFTGTYGNFMALSNHTSTNHVYGISSTNGILFPDEAWGLDTKIDDGQPDGGMLMTSNNSVCVTSATPGTAEYNLSNETKRCSLFFLRAF